MPKPIKPIKPIKLMPKLDKASVLHTELQAPESLLKLHTQIYYRNLVAYVGALGIFCVCIPSLSANHVYSWSVFGLLSLWGITLWRRTFAFRLYGLCALRHKIAEYIRHWEDRTSTHILALLTENTKTSKPHSQTDTSPALPSAQQPETTRKFSKSPKLLSWIGLILGVYASPMEAKVKNSQDFVKTVEDALKTKNLGKEYNEMPADKKVKLLVDIKRAAFLDPQSGVEESEILKAISKDGPGEVNHG